MNNFKLNNIIIERLIIERLIIERRTATAGRQKEINAELSKRYEVKYEYLKRLYAW